MTEGFLWGGINVRKFCKFFFKNFWMVIVVTIITYLGLGLVDQWTHGPTYTYTAVAAVYPKSTHFRYHTIENAAELSSKTSVIGSVINSDMFQLEFHNQYPDLQDCSIDCIQIANTDLLVMHATSGSQENAFEGIRDALECYSRFSGDMTGSPEVNIIFQKKAPSLIAGSSKIHNNRSKLSVLSGLITAGLFLLMYLVKKTYKTEHCIKKRFKNVRFFSLSFIQSALENKEGILSKKSSHPPIRKLALEIRQALRKCCKNTLFVTSFADKDGGTLFISELARELAEQNERVILIGTEAKTNEGISGLEVSDDRKMYYLQDLLQHRCAVKDAIFYSDELKCNCILNNQATIDGDVFYTVDDARRVLAHCMEYSDIVLVDGVASFSSHYAQIWQEASDATIALCRQDDADFFKVDQMLSDLQKTEKYFVGCVLSGF